MLGDNELDATSAQLADFTTAQTRHQETLTEVLAKYSSLVEDYRRLKSDYEEERDSRERYKQLVRGQERNPFVLVLVDGDGYVFNDELIGGGAEGGQRAASALDNVVKASLRGKNLDNCRIMVRIYTNLVGLSKTLSRYKLCGAEKRSLAPFAANFTRSNDLFDFVDAGELKENADFKIRAMFRQFVDNTQCRHIYFAGCHDVGYINELTPYKNNRDKITLVSTYNFHPEFSKLNMGVESLGNLFRVAPLDAPAYQGGAYRPPTTQPSMPSVPPPNAGPADLSTQQPPVCTHFLKGICRYGANCRKMHPTPNNTPNGGSNPNWRFHAPPNSTSNDGHFAAPVDSDFMRAHTGPGSQNTIQQYVDFESLLPNPDQIPPNTIPVNAHNARLDPFLPPPSPEDRNAFIERTKTRKLCNKFHLTGDCPESAQTCQYDHSPAPEGVLNYLKSVAWSQPCPKKGACRNAGCSVGHLCQKADCKYRGGKSFCKFPGPMHFMDLKLSDFAEATNLKNGMNGNDGGREEEDLWPPAPQTGGANGAAATGLGGKNEAGMSSPTMTSTGISGGGRDLPVRKQSSQGSDEEEGGASMGHSLGVGVAVDDELD